jgi:acyl-coenzyme A thioesterase PaaI-like protein
MDAPPIVDQPVSVPEKVSRRFAASPVEGGVAVRALAVGRRGTGRLTLEVPLRPDEPPLVAVAVSVDTAIGMAVHSAPPTRIAGPTLDLRLDPVADPAPGARHLRVEGEVLGAPTEADPTGVARALVVDDTGRTVAHAVGTMVIEPLGPRTYGGLDKVVGLPRLEVPRLVRALAAAPVAGDALALPLGPWLGNLRGSVHGGMVLVIGRLAARRITGVAGRMLDTSVEYLRPLPLGGTLTCRNVPERAGRRYRTDRTELVLPDGKIGAIVRSATALG